MKNTENICTIRDMLTTEEIAVAYAIANRVVNNIEEGDTRKIRRMLNQARNMR